MSDRYTQHTSDRWYQQNIDLIASDSSALLALSMQQVSIHAYFSWLKTACLQVHSIFWKPFFSYVEDVSMSLEETSSSSHVWERIALLSRLRQQHGLETSVSRMSSSRLRLSCTYYGGGMLLPMKSSNWPVPVLIRRILANHLSENFHRRRIEENRLVSNAGKGDLVSPLQKNVWRGSSTEERMRRHTMRWGEKDLGDKHETVSTSPRRPSISSKREAQHTYAGGNSRTSGCTRGIPT